MEYQKAKAEVVLFDNSDVVTTSCTGPSSETSCKGGNGPHGPWS